MSLSDVGLPRVLEYSSSTRVVNYSSNFLLLEYSLISISGCKFPFPVSIFLQSQDELLEFMQTWGFAISFAPCQPGNRSEYIHGGRAHQPAARLKPKASAQPYGTIDATSVFFGRPFIKRFALCYRTIVLSVCLSVCLYVWYVCPVCL